MRSAARRRGNLVRLPTRRSVPWRLITVLAVVVGALAAVALTWRVREVRIVGAESVPVEDIARAASLAGGERMLLTRFERVADRVEALPAVRSATVSRRLWGSIVIAVVEREPVAVLDGRPHLVVDADGVIFEAPALQVKPPKLAGWRGRPDPGTGVDAASRAVLAAYPSFPEALRERTLTIRVGERLSLLIRGGAKVLFGSPVELERKAAAAETVLADAGRRGLELAYVDVRSPSTPVGREWNVPTPSPEPTPVPGATD